MRRMLRTETGAVTPFIAVLVVAIIGMTGVLADVTGQMRAVARAENIATEAARAGGQAIDVQQELDGGSIVLDPTAAEAAAKSYLTAAGASSDSTVSVSADLLHVTVTAIIDYTPPIEGAFGAGPRQIKATVTADVVPR